MHFCIQKSEAKEGVKVARENRTLATITFQNYFRMYSKLSGMTGTAKTEEDEFRGIYNLDVVQIPTNRPMIRVDKNDLLFKSVAAKYNALCDEIVNIHKTGQPILVGTVSVEKSEIISKMLDRRGVKTNYPRLYFVSSTTKVLTDFGQLRQELEREDFQYVVPDFRLNKAFNELSKLPQKQKDKVEFLCNECCRFDCKDRKRCYEAVSRKNLGESAPEHRCTASDASGGYRFSKAMKNPGFIGTGDIRNIYLPMGFSNFKIEGRGLGSALILEFLLYYMTKPEYQLQVREEIYLDNMLDLF